MIGLTGVPIHKGSWGLPDFGLTEMFSPNRTAQGGSNAMPGGSQTTTRTTGGTNPYTRTQNVQGVTIPAGNTLFNKTTPTSNVQGATMPAGDKIFNNSNSSNNSPQKVNPVTRGNEYWSSEEDYNKDQAEAQRQGFSSAEELRAYTRERENAARGAIDSVWKGNQNRLNQWQSQLPTWKTEDEGTLGTTVQGMRGQLGTTKDAAIQKLGSFREDVGNRTQLGIENIQDNLRNLLRASGMQLGAMGAGSSSASEVMAPYAFQKQATRSMGDVTKQSNDQYGELDRQEIDTQTQYDMKLKDVDMWEAEEKQGITDRIRSFENAIREAQMNNDTARANALASLEVDLMNSAQQKLDQIEATALQGRESLKSWTRDRLAQLNNMKLELANSANFSPQEIVGRELTGLGGMSGGGGSDFYNPAVWNKKRTDQV